VNDFTRRAARHLALEWFWLHGSYKHIAVHCHGDTGDYLR